MANVEHTLSPRRTPPHEVRQLEARVLDILTEQPGLTRSEVALRLGVERTRLDRPITNLIHAAKILRDGHKDGTTYRRRWSDLEPRTSRGAT
jgi:predicted transcriptional regulator